MQLIINNLKQKFGEKSRFHPIRGTNQVAMNTNRIDKEIPFTTQGVALEKVKDLNTLMNPYLLKNCNEDLLTGFAKIGKNTEAFVERALELAHQQSYLVPEFANLEQAKIDFKLYQDLRGLEDELWQLLSKIAQTRTLAGAEALDFAQDFYKYTGLLSKNNHAIATGIHKDLSSRFRRKSYKESAQNAAQD
ncbi:MAG: hypothetical protein L6Q78_08810 [Bacteroidia bacterium]|nr:hypothetical protein [Bacteroidia bacterium]